MKKYLLVAFLLFSIPAKADCHCACYQGESVPVCDSGLDIPILTCIGIC